MRTANPICAIYARVSTDQQAEKYSLPSQLAAMKKYAAERGYRTSDEFTFVDDYTGTSLDRPALTGLRAAVQSHAVDVVLAFTLDRLSRDLGDVVFLKREFEKHGAQLDFVSMTVDDTPTGELYFHMAASFAQYERRQILERTQRGKVQKARDGYVNCRTYGYRYFGRGQGERGRLEVNEAEAAVVRQIYAWRLEGRSHREIARRLNESGIKPMKGRTWNPATIHRILRNRTYTGTFYSGRSEACEAKKPRTTRRWNNGKSSARRRPESEWIKIAVPRIIDDATFDVVQSINERILEMQRGRPSMNYLLRGLVWCGRCGKKCRGRQNAGRPLYRCAHQDPVTYKRACWTGGVSALRLEATVWNSIMDTLANPDNLREAYARHREEIFGKQADQEGERSRLKEAIKTARRRERNLQDMAADAAADTFASIKAEWRIAQARRIELERQLAGLLPPSTRAAADDSLAGLSKAFETVRNKANREEQREILAEVVQRISYADDNVEIECAVPVKQYCLQDVARGIGLSFFGGRSVRQSAVDAAGDYLSGSSHGSLLETEMAQGAGVGRRQDRRHHCLLSQPYSSTKAQGNRGTAGAKMGVSD